MTNKELDGAVVMDDSRIWRVAKGAGVMPQEVVGLLDCHKQFGTMVDGMNKGGLLKGNDAAFASKMKRNPNAVLAELQKSMDPRMLKQMGGMGNLEVGGGSGAGLVGASESSGGGGSRARPSLTHRSSHSPALPSLQTLMKGLAQAPPRRSGGGAGGGGAGGGGGMADGLAELTKMLGGGMGGGKGGKGGGMPDISALLKGMGMG